MPKRKRTRSPDLCAVYKKLKVLERQFREQSRRPRRSRIIASSSSGSGSSRESSPAQHNLQLEEGCSSSHDEVDPIDGDIREILASERNPASAAATPAPPAPSATAECSPAQSQAPQSAATTAPTSAPPAPLAQDAAPTASTAAPPALEEPPDASVDLDDALLEILGEDPTAKVEYGPPVHAEIAKRLEHLATTGLDKEVRKELTEKYRVPENCVRTGAPILNDEIRAALPETVVKRDKILLTKQKQLATVISCTASAITDQLRCKEKNQDLLKKLMDMGRLLCDIQHTESLARRNFSLSSVKKEMKEHLTNTKIDKQLFGENLSEALKTAKTVNKSGADLKIPLRNTKKNLPAKTTKNWKHPAPARRGPGPQKNREQRETRETSQREPPANSSKRSPPRPRTNRRR